MLLPKRLGIILLSVIFTFAYNVSNPTVKHVLLFLHWDLD